MIDTDRFRKVSFKEFCDEWLDNMNESYDDCGEIWISLFRSEIFVSLLNLRQKAERTKVFVEMISNPQDFYKIIQSFTTNDDDINLPAYERLIPILRPLGVKEDDNFLTVISILKHAKNIKAEAEKTSEKRDHKT